MSIKAAYKYRIKPFIIRALHTPKWFIQRGRRGWSDRDAWNADMFLASQIAGIAEWLVKNGHGVPSSYAYQPDFNDPVEIMAERRDADYRKHIAVFREYAKNGHAFDQEWKDELGGVLDSEIDDSLQWFAKHFVELWD